MIYTLASGAKLPILPEAFYLFDEDGLYIDRSMILVELLETPRLKEAELYEEFQKDGRPIGVFTASLNTDDGRYYWEEILDRDVAPQFGIYRGIDLVKSEYEADEDWYFVRAIYEYQGSGEIQRKIFEDEEGDPKLFR